MPRGFASSFGTRTLGDEVLVATGHNPQEMLERASGDDPTSSLSSSLSSPVASLSPTPADPLFPGPSSSAPSVPSRRPPSQTVLMWIFAVVALSLLAIMVVWRYVWTRIRNRRAGLQRHQGRAGGGGGTTGLLRSHSGRIVRDSDFVNSWDRETRPIALSPAFFRTDIMPVVDQRGVQINGPRRTRGGRVRAWDVDAGGRRAGGRDSDTGHGAQDDELPAYEAGKGPPGYHVVTLELAPLAGENGPQAYPSSDDATAIPQTQTGTPDSAADSGDQPSSPSPGRLRS
ncbi:hypothetical protein BU17DRAFT_95832 [Hysterangium stoloniferum]|nr:hypothetical protein BU17DRAFT_95832 [Hysterangium stoloniferum]